MVVYNLSLFLYNLSIQYFMMIINHGAHALVHAKARRPSIEIRTSYRRPIELKLPAFGVDSEFRP